MMDQNQINEDYREIADGCGVELDGFYEVQEDNTVKWISYYGD